MSRTSILRSWVSPTRRISRSWIARSSLTWSSAGISVISSRNSVPPSAAAKRPTLLATAPVKAPLTWPKSSDSISPSGMAPQLTETKGLSRRGLLKWMARATSSLPVPLSPVIITVDGLSAILRMVSKTSTMRALLPMMFSKLCWVSSCLRRYWFSSRRRLRSSAFLTIRLTSSSLNGLVM